MKTIYYLITEPEGLHALPATALIAKSPFGLMALGAHYGDTIVFTAKGPDEEKAQQFLCQETH